MRAQAEFTHVFGQPEIIRNTILQLMKTANCVKRFAAQRERCAESETVRAGRSRDMHRRHEPFVDEKRAEPRPHFAYPPRAIEAGDHADLT